MKETLSCSFCGKRQDAVEKLISSPKDLPRAYICAECVTVCCNILEEDCRPKNQEPQHRPPTHIPLWLLRMLGGRKPELK